MLLVQTVKPSTTFFFAVLTLFWVPESRGQSVFEDSSVVFLNNAGERLSLGEVKDIVGRGHFKILERRNAQTGARTAILMAADSNEVKKAEIESTRRIAKLKGKSLAGLEFHDRKGVRHAPGSGAGNVLVIACWFIACRPCIDEMPILNSIASDYHGRGVTFLAMGRDEKLPTEDFLRNHEFLYSNVPSSGSVLDSLGVEVYPTHLLIDRSGTIREVILGKDETLEEKHRAMIERYLYR